MLDFKGAKKYIIDRLETELRPNLYYHGIHHTMDVYEVSIKIAELENVSQEEKILVNTAALYHDSGFMYRYLNNEVLAEGLVHEVLPEFGYNAKQIDAIGEIILTTRIKERPKTLLQKIMCDADYDYLGRSDAKKIADTLYKELHEYGFPFTEMEWIDMQRKFLKKHRYYTASSKELRLPKKIEYCNYLEHLEF